MQLFLFTGLRSGVLAGHCGSVNAWLALRNQHLIPWGWTWRRGEWFGTQATTRLKCLWINCGCFPPLWRQSAQLLREKKEEAANNSKTVSIQHLHDKGQWHCNNHTHLLGSSCCLLLCLCQSPLESVGLLLILRRLPLVLGRQPCKLVTRNQRFNSTSVLYISHGSVLGCRVPRNNKCGDAASERRRRQRSSLTVKERRQQSLFLPLLFRHFAWNNYNFTFMNGWVDQTKLVKKD